MKARLSELFLFSKNTAHVFSRDNNTLLNLNIDEFGMASVSTFGSSDLNKSLHLLLMFISVIIGTLNNLHEEFCDRNHMELYPDTSLQSVHHKKL